MSGRRDKLLAHLRNNNNLWVERDSLEIAAGAGSHVESIVGMLRGDGYVIEEKTIKSANGKDVKAYRTINPKRGHYGEWDCSLCHNTVSDGYAIGFLPTLDPNISSGYCDQCKKKVFFKKISKT